MQSITFGTAEPLDHVTRALDILRTMGFGLQGLSIEKAGDDSFRVELRYEPRGDLPEQTFLDRLARNTNLSSVLIHRADAVAGSLCR